MTFTRLATPRWPRALASLLAATRCWPPAAAAPRSTSPSSRSASLPSATRPAPAHPCRRATGANTASTASTRPATSTAVCCRSGCSRWLRVYGFVFAECNPASLPEPRARSFAAAGARVADVAAQVEAAQVAARRLRATRIWPPCWRAPTTSSRSTHALPGGRQVRGRDEMLAAARDRGKRLAAGGQSDRRAGWQGHHFRRPQRRADAVRAEGEGAAHRHRPCGAADTAHQRLQRAAGREHLARRALYRAGAGRPAIPGHRLLAGSYGFANVTVGACTVELPDCTTATLVPDADATQYLWADDTRFSSGAHAQLAALAVDRAQRNPF